MEKCKSCNSEYIKMYKSQHVCHFICDVCSKEFTDLEKFSTHFLDEHQDNQAEILELPNISNQQSR